MTNIENNYLSDNSMLDYRSLQEYEAYVRNLNLGQLRDIANHIDRFKYPDRYQLVIAVIGEREESLHLAPSITPIAPDIPKGVVFIRSTYGFFLVMGGLALPYGIWFREKPFSIADVLQFGFNWLVYLTIYLGIKYRKSWVQTLVLFMAWIGLITSFLSMSNRSSNSQMIIGEVSHLLFGAFFAYQLYIFSKKSTKDYFNDAGATLIG